MTLAALKANIQAYIALDMAPDGKPYPATAQHAIRQGTMLAKNIEAALANHPENKKPFTYRTLGQLAAIGHHRGAANSRIPTSPSGFSTRAISSSPCW